MLGSQTFVVLCACAILRWQLGTRWRYGLTSRYVWQRLFWLGLVTPIGIQCSMYLVGSFFDFPLKISTFFGDADAIFTVVDLLSLFTAVLIYNMLFYYLTRMIVSPHFAQILWRRDIAPSLGKEKRAFTLSWLAALSVLLLLLCTPYENDFIAGYLVPVFFIIFSLGVGKLHYPFLNLTWAVSTLCLLNYNQNFLQGVETEYSLAFILAVLISFSVCLLYMVRIYHRSEWLNRRWHLQALTDPLTLLPNFRALEQAPEQEAGKSFCCLRIDNLEFIESSLRLNDARSLYPLNLPYAAAVDAQESRKLYQLPGSELLLVLSGPETEGRLQHMVNILNSRQIHWNNTGLDMGYGAGGVLMEIRKPCNPCWGS